ncbi:MAG: orotate phosphoribosyltransferase [Candidatus Methanoperedenaceae archaeon]|nr:MAG: orotate phosphoribosyltransferase [Candidatus Methanoperedenaceae archaeon]
MTSITDSLKDCKAIRFGAFTLASGKKSSYYIDIKKAIALPRILRQIALEISEKIKQHSIKADYIGCVALGGVPIAVAVSLETDLPLIIIRKEAKEYGTKGQIVGDFIRNSRVLMVEDVATTGGSVLKAIELLRDEGLLVEHVIVVVDREEGALSALSKARVELIPLAKVSELLKK